MREVMTSLPSVFGAEAFEKLADEMFSSSFASDRFAYPTDIAQVLDDDGQVKGYEIGVALAGIDKKNVEVSTDNDVLVIKVNKKEASEDKNRRFLQKGISQRSMESRFGLHGIDKAQIKAAFTEGMLKVELPLAEEVKPRTIAIG